MDDLGARGQGCGIRGAAAIAVQFRHMRRMSTVAEGAGAGVGVWVGVSGRTSSPGLGHRPAGLGQRSQLSLALPGSGQISRA